MSCSPDSFASIGFIKRGTSTLPIDIEPPRRGTVTIKLLLIFWSINMVLNNSTSASPTKRRHSFFEKEAKTKFISFFEGNLKLRIRHCLINNREQKLALSFYYYTK